LTGFTLFALSIPPLPPTSTYHLTGPISCPSLLRCSFIV
jgi:hypothetical protein